MRRLIVFLVVLAGALTLHRYGPPFAGSWGVWLSALITAMALDGELSRRGTRRDAFRAELRKALTARKKAVALRRLARCGAWSRSEMRVMEGKLRAIGGEPEVERLKRQLLRQKKHLPFSVRPIPFWHCVWITTAFSVAVVVILVLVCGD